MCLGPLRLERLDAAARIGELTAHGRQLQVDRLELRDDRILIGRPAAGIGRLVGPQLLPIVLQLRPEELEFELRLRDFRIGAGRLRDLGTDIDDPVRGIASVDPTYLVVQTGTPCSLTNVFFDTTTTFSGPSPGHRRTHHGNGSRIPVRPTSEPPKSCWAHADKRSEVCGVRSA
jgi:hypothetical protein